MVEELKPMTFSLKRKEVDVLIQVEGKPDVECKLRELDGQGRDLFLKNMSNRTRLDTNGAPTSGLKDMDNLYAYLISLSLFKVEDGGSFNLKEIQTWPATMQSELFKAAQTLSGLKDVDEDGKKS